MSGRLYRGGVMMDEKEWKEFVGQDKLKFIVRNMKYTRILSAGKFQIEKTAYFYRIIDIKGNRKFILAKFMAEKLLRGGYIKKIVNMIEPGIAANIDCKFELTTDQKAVFSNLKNYFTDPLSGAVLVLDTGLGKTYVAMKMISYFRTRALVIAPKRSIIEGWVKDLQNTNAKVAVYPNIYVENADIWLMTIKSAIATEYNINGKKISATNFMKQFGAIVYDEIPDFVSERNREVFWRCNFRYTLGLTATPNERVDKMDIVYRRHVGPLVYAKEMPDFNPETVKFKGKVTIIKYTGPKVCTRHITNTKNGMMSYMEMVNQISMDNSRNQLIIDRAVELYNRGKNVFVFCATRAHVKLLYDLTRGVLADAPELHQLMGGSTAEDLEYAKNKSRIIFITFSYGGTGLSIVKMDSIIFGTMRKTGIRQILGRICRRGGDVSSLREIIDIVDTKTKLKSQLYARKKIYEEKGFDIDIEDIDYKDVVSSKSYNTLLILLERRSPGIINKILK